MPDPSCSTSQLRTSFATRQSIEQVAVQVETTPTPGFAWSGLALALYTDAPASFWITIVAPSGYLFARLLRTTRAAVRETGDAR